MENKYCCQSVRLSRYLYSLGFDKESIFVNEKENWLFEKSPALQESLDFFFYMRKILKDKRMNKGADDYANSATHQKMDR